MTDRALETSKDGIRGLFSLEVSDRPSSGGLSPLKSSRKQEIGDRISHQ